MEEKLKNWNKPTEYIQEQNSGEVNILKFNDDETDEITIPGLLKIKKFRVFKLIFSAVHNCC